MPTMVTSNLGGPVHACRLCGSSKGTLFQCCYERCESDVHMTCALTLCTQNKDNPRAAIFKYCCGLSDESTDDEALYVVPAPVVDAPPVPEAASIKAAAATPMKRSDAPAVTPEAASKRHKSNKSDDDDDDKKLPAEAPAAPEPLVLHSTAWFRLEELNLRRQEVESHVLMCAAVEKEAEESILLLQMKRKVLEKQT
jgi:hypothetical protein